MGQTNIDGIKTAIKAIFDTANTTTGSPIDISAGLNTRLSRVFKVNPARLPIQASLFPYLTIYATTKDPIEQITIGHKGNQASAMRKATLNLDIFGCVFEPLVPDINEDQGVENIERLMENVEEVLRSNPTMGGTVAWAMPTRCQYEDIPYDEGSSLRAGILELECTIHY